MDGGMVGWIRNQLGLKTETVALATGNVHQKLLDIKNNGVVPRIVAASNNIKYSDDTEVQYDVASSSGNWTRLRAAKVFVNGIVRVVFDAMEASSSGAGNVIIRINGVDCGTLRSTLNDESYTTYSEDMYIAYGDDIALYGAYTSEYSVDIKIQNFKIKFDFSTAASIGITKTY